MLNAAYFEFWISTGYTIESQGYGHNMFNNHKTLKNTRLSVFFLRWCPIHQTDHPPYRSWWCLMLEQWIYGVIFDIVHRCLIVRVGVSIIRDWSWCGDWHWHWQCSRRCCLHHKCNSWLRCCMGYSIREVDKHHRYDNEVYQSPSSTNLKDDKQDHFTPECQKWNWITKVSSEHFQ